MTAAARIYDEVQLTKIAELFSGLKDLFKEFEGPEDSVSEEHALLIWSADIIIQHRAGYRVAKIGLEDWLYVEFGEEEETP